MKTVILNHEQLLWKNIPDHVPEAEHGRLAAAILDSATFPHMVSNETVHTAIRTAAERAATIFLGCVNTEDLSSLATATISVGRGLDTVASEAVTSWQPFASRHLGEMKRQVTRSDSGVVVTYYAPLPGDHFLWSSYFCPEQSQDRSLLLASERLVNDVSLSDLPVMNRSGARSA